MQVADEKFRLFKMLMAVPLTVVKSLIKTSKSSYEKARQQLTRENGDGEEPFDESVRCGALQLFSYLAK